MMISPAAFLNMIKLLGVNFFVGIPDSLMKGLNFEIINSCSNDEHVISSNEGSAIGHAIGHYAATKQLAAVYMQNSGLGNSYNPLISLADPAVYGIPMLLLIGWRGELDVNNNQLKDEPQHVKQGQITLSTLSDMDIPYVVIDRAELNWKREIERLIKRSKIERRPVAVVFRKDTFESIPSSLAPQTIKQDMTREEAIEAIVEYSTSNDIFVASTGMISRELFEIRKKENMSHETDFLTVGGMGHSSQIAARIAANFPKRRVICLDGDGALMMHTGGMAECSVYDNFLHILLNNGAHDSVGGQPTQAFRVNLQQIANGFGYKYVYKSTCKNEIIKSLQSARKGSTFIEIQCKRGNRKDLGRPDTSPKENLNNFMKFLERLRNDE
jgi:phosphonopyruvate decarboxylase